ncbi:MAG: glycoside hydrolase family 2 TIM barrel-domain containing protein [Chthoniobacteraceae bacterium]
MRTMLRALLGAVLWLPACPKSVVATTQPDSPRESLNFNRDWKFQLGDVPGAEKPDAPDEQWQAVGLPHSFSLPYFGSPKFYVGYGWYRKHFTTPSSWSGRRINLEFDGVFQVADVFVNGKSAGRHEGGYTGFILDITDAVNPGDNTVAIRVNNLWNARLAPRAGEHVFSGGIYRNVRLVVTSPLHVAWYGTSVTTPQISAASATVNVKTEVVNESPIPTTATLKTEIVDAANQVVAEMTSTQAVAARSTAVFDQTSRPVARPKLWSPEHPYLYHVNTTLLKGSATADRFVSPLGFRWLKFTADQGFFLNGEHRYLKGTNVHQDHAGWGDAVADSGFSRDVNLVKEAGFDFIRGSHYPHAPAFVQACDEEGVLLWSENAFWGIGGFKPDGYWDCGAYPANPADQPEFEASVKRQLGEMIRMYRNHPSVIVWSMGNETFFSDKAVMPKVKTFLKELVIFSHQCDPTRPVAIGGAQRPLNEDRIDLVGDVAGYNGDGSSQAAFQNPGVPSVVSEYGSTTAIRPGKYEPGWGSLAKDNGQAVYPWRAGQAIWCMFDHGSIAGANLGRMGIVDYFRIPKRAWYWYRNEYRHIPPPPWPGNGQAAALTLSADKTTLKSVEGTDDAQISVTVLDATGKPTSQSPEVTLTIESGPGEFPTGPAITFAPKSDIAILEGKAAIEFRSYDAGKTFIRATSPGLKDATIEITSQGTPAFIAGQTPPVQARPYVRFTGGATPASVIRVGFQNPVNASSETPGHGSSLANDGDAATCWQAGSGDRNAWWQVDMEKTMKVQSVKIVFPTDGPRPFRVEVSQNRESGWTPVAEDDGGTARERVVPVASGISAEFLRVIFPNQPGTAPAAISELEITGVLNAP